MNPLSTIGADDLLGGAPEAFYIRLATGDPGAEGNENIPVNNFTRLLRWTPPAARKRTNKEVAEWTETFVLASETYTHFTLWGKRESEIKPEEFLGSGELSAPVAVEKGDTVKFNIGALQIEVP